MAKKEAQARIKINKLLEEAGWRFFDNDKGKANISCEHRITKKKVAQDELGNDFEKSENGFIDYLLLNEQSRPIALVEAKSEKINPLNAKDQARDYARSLGLRYVFLSNGNLHYFWDLESGNPTRISRIHSLKDLGEANKWSPEPEKLASIKIDENFIAVSQDLNFINYTAKQKQEAIITKDLRLLRDYQLNAVWKLQKDYVKGDRRFLFEMATGTGKTLTAAAIVKLFIRSNNADRVLFLVDRVELERQAYDDFNKYLANDSIRTVIYKRNKEDWHNAQVVITTIQSLSYNNRYLTEFTPNDFQFIISDEAHRTIGGNNRVIFEYFIGSKLGLTATPRDYLKGVDQDKLSEKDPRQLEKRMLLDTYQTFGCEDGIPTFRFSLLDAVQHVPPYLVNPKKLDCRTEVTTELLTQQGWSMLMIDENGEEVEDNFYKRDFEKKFFSPETNLSFIRTFLQHAKRDPITDEIGKTIFFCVSIHHAAKVTQILNEEIEKMYPGVYNSDFAVQLTSNIEKAQDKTIQFRINKLNGTTRYNKNFPEYPSSKTRVCVTVGMMTTGYDCRDILNLALCRPIFSPTDFIQIKGRGTRTFNFEYDKKSEPVQKKKDNFFLFDYFANCEFFEQEYDYEEKLKIPVSGTSGEPPVTPPPPPENYVFTGPDEMIVVEQQEVGKEGMKVDREMYRNSFEFDAKESLKFHPEILYAIESEDWELVEKFVKENLYQKPRYFYSTEKLRESYGIRRRLTLTEILQKIFKGTPFKSENEIAEEHFQRYLSTEGINGAALYELRNLFINYLLNPEIREILDEKKYSLLATESALSLDDISKLSQHEIETTLNYIRDNIPLNQFMYV